MAVLKKANGVTYPAGEALAAADVGRGGVFNTSGQIVAAGAGVYPHVIIRDIQATIGNGVPCLDVPTSVEVSVTLAGTVTQGQELVTDANGDFVAGTSGDKFCLIAMVAGATGETIGAKVVPADTVA